MTLIRSESIVKHGNATGPIGNVAKKPKVLSFNPKLASEGGFMDLKVGHPSSKTADCTAITSKGVKTRQ